METIKIKKRNIRQKMKKQKVTQNQVHGKLNPEVSLAICSSL